MSVANKHRNQLRRAKLNDEINDVLDKGAFDTLFEAKQFALERERHRLQIKLSNDKALTEEEKEKINQDISVITISIKEEGYSSLIIDTVELP
jgi:DNA sulfur modification protein DndC